MLKNNCSGVDLTESKKIRKAFDKHANSAMNTCKKVSETCDDISEKIDENVDNYSSTMGRVREDIVELQKIFLTIYDFSKPFTDFMERNLNEFKKFIIKHFK